MCSGTGENLKVGIGHTSGAKRQKTNFVVPLHFLLALLVKLVVCGERFPGGQYSLVSILFAVLLITVPPCAQPFVKVGDVLYGVGAGVCVCVCVCAPLQKER